MIVICGGGITGLSIARELVKRDYNDIVILEKEKEIGVHASGRNSGVLHAGIYYTPESLKAKFCLRGNELMKEFCKSKNIPIKRSGKVIVTKNEDELEILHELHKRAVNNKVEVKLIDKKELSEIEPYAKTVEQALYSPLTAVINPKDILKEIEKELIKSKKVKILKETKFIKLINNKTILTSKGKLNFELFINAAGAYADMVAHSFGVGLEYKMLPFKGTYKKLKREKSYIVNGNIYPVPDIKNPFLGVHLTKGYDGEVYIGPTAIPAFGRENYGIFRGIDLEAVQILYRDLIMFLKNEKFRNPALEEPKKYLSRYFFKDVKPLAKNIEFSDISPSLKVGIRPQLVNWKTKELEMDFVVMKDSNSIHILNAISPAFTSSFAFAEFVVNEYLKL